MADPTTLVPFRLTAAEIEALDKIGRLAKAPDRTAALRVAIEVAPMGLAARFLEDVDELLERVRGLSAELERVQQNAATHEQTAAEIRQMAREGTPHAIEIEPQFTFTVTAGLEHPVAARVINADGKTIVNAQVKWEVHPRYAGRVEHGEDSRVAHFVAGDQPMAAILRASCGDVVSPDINVHVWARTFLGGVNPDATVAPSGRPASPFFDHSKGGRPPRVRR